MLEFKKSELEAVLLTICAYSTPKEGEVQKMVSGLLIEDLTLGSKRRLQKIHKLTQEHYKELIDDLKKVQEEFKDDQALLEKEALELFNETVKIDAEPILLAHIENVSTSNNYSFDIIEKIAV